MDPACNVNSNPLNAASAPQTISAKRHTPIRRNHVGGGLADLRQFGRGDLASHPKFRRNRAQASPFNTERVVQDYVPDPGEAISAEQIPATEPEKRAIFL